MPHGLTALRRANLGDKKGLFYSAFFELSIGFERVLKFTQHAFDMAIHFVDEGENAAMEDAEATPGAEGEEALELRAPGCARRVRR